MASRGTGPPKRKASNGSRTHLARPEPGSVAPAPSRVTQPKTSLTKMQSRVVRETDSGTKIQAHSKTKTSTVTKLGPVAGPSGTSAPGSARIRMAGKTANVQKPTVQTTKVLVKGAGLRPTGKVDTKTCKSTCPSASAAQEPALAPFTEEMEGGRAVPTGRYFFPATGAVPSFDPEETKLRAKLKKYTPTGLGTWKVELDNPFLQKLAPLKEKHPDFISGLFLSQRRDFEPDYPNPELEQRLDPSMPEEYWSVGLREAMSLETGVYEQENPETGQTEQFTVEDASIERQLAAEMPGPSHYQARSPSPRKQVSPMLRSPSPQRPSQGPSRFSPRVTSQGVTFQAPALSPPDATFDRTTPMSPIGGLPPMPAVAPVGHIEHPEFQHTVDVQMVSPPRMQSPVGEIEAQQAIYMQRMMQATPEGTTVATQLRGTQIEAPGQAKQIDITKVDRLPAPSTPRPPSPTTQYVTSPRDEYTSPPTADAYGYSARSPERQQFVQPPVYGPRLQYPTAYSTSPTQSQFLEPRMAFPRGMPRFEPGLAPPQMRPGLIPPRSPQMRPSGAIRFSGLRPPPPSAQLRPPGLQLRPPGLQLRPPGLQLRPPGSQLRPPGLQLRPPGSQLRPPGVTPTHEMQQSTSPYLQVGTSTAKPVTPVRLSTTPSKISPPVSPISLEASTPIPPSPAEASLNVVRRLVDEERHDVVLSQELPPSLSRKLNKLKKKPQSMRVLEETLDQSVPIEDENETMKSDVVAELMYNQENGISPPRSPQERHDHPSPAVKELQIEVSPAAPAPLDDIVVPLGGAAVDDVAVVNEEMTEATAEGTEEIPSGDAFSESKKEDQEQPPPSPPKPRGELAGQKAPWEIDLGSLEDMVGGKMSGWDNLPSDESVRATAGRVDYILDVEKPLHHSCVQLRGSQLPAWFPGFYSVLPHVEGYVRLERSPSRTFAAAWHLFTPYQNADQSEVVIL